MSSVLEICNIYILFFTNIFTYIKLILHIDRWILVIKQLLILKPYELINMIIKES
jgi:hypothetical protein